MNVSGFASSCCNVPPPIWPRLFESRVFECHHGLSVPPSLSLELWRSCFDPHTERALRVLESQDPEKKAGEEKASFLCLSGESEKGTPAGLWDFKSTLVRGRTIVWAQSKLERTLPFSNVMWSWLHIETGYLWPPVGSLDVPSQT